VSNLIRIIKASTLTFLLLAFLSFGHSSSVTNFDASSIKSYDMENSVSLTSSSQELTDVQKEVEGEKAASCKNVTTLEKPARLPKFLRNLTGDRKLRPKDKVPDFTLPRADGEEVNLYEVLAENDYVVIDFWATACGPCIAQFPKLKEIYSTYKDETFEIVSVCTDITHEQWEESLEEHQLPWIDVGEINAQGLVGPTSKAFRLLGLPRSYLVDTNGCILHTHIFPIELEKFLGSEYGEALESEDEGGDLETSGTNTD